MKKVLSLGALALAGVLAFTGCSCSTQEETGTAYGLVHKKYLGVATVTHKGTDVTNVTFEEVMLPDDWAKVSAGTTATTLGTVTGTLTTAITEDDLTSLGSSSKYAKYIKIGDKYFTAANAYAIYDSSKNTTNYYVDYQSGTWSEGAFASDGKIDSLIAYVQTSTGGKWYYEAMKAGKYDLVNASGTTLGLTYTDGNAKASCKSTNGYGSTKFDWSGNMKAMADYLVANDNMENIDVMAYTASAVDATTNKKYYATSDTDVVTSATLTDFYDYMNLAVDAYNK